MSEFEIEREHTRQEAAEYLHKLASGLKENNSVTFISGEESATIDPPQTVHFRMETNDDSSWIGTDKGRSVVIELGWESDDVEPNQDLIIVNQPERAKRDIHETDQGSSGRNVDEPDRR